MGLELMEACTASMFPLEAALRSLMAIENRLQSLAAGFRLRNELRLSFALRISMTVRHPILSLLLALSAVGPTGMVTARAESDPAPTYQRELAMQRYKNCHWTDEMGKYAYACIKRNEGFGTHWCYDETLEAFCPAQLEAAKKARSQPAARDKPSN